MVFLAIINGVLSIITKVILKKHVLSTFPLFSQISDFNKLKSLIDKDISYEILYFTYLLSTIFFGIAVLLIIIAIIFVAK